MHLVWRERQSYLAIQEIAGESIQGAVGLLAVDLELHSGQFPLSTPVKSSSPTAPIHAELVLFQDYPTMAHPVYKVYQDVITRKHESERQMQARGTSKKKKWERRGSKVLYCFCAYATVCHTSLQPPPH